MISLMWTECILHAFFFNDSITSEAQRKLWINYEYFNQGASSQFILLIFIIDKIQNNINISIFSFERHILWGNCKSFNSCVVYIISQFKNKQANSVVKSPIFCDSITAASQHNTEDLCFLLSSQATWNYSHWKSI